MTKPQAAPFVHPCVHFGGKEVGKRTCEDIGSVHCKNMISCTPNRCKSPWRFCSACVLQGVIGRLPEGDSAHSLRKNPDGLCEFHAENGRDVRRGVSLAMRAGSRLIRDIAERAVPKQAEGGRAMQSTQPVRPPAGFPPRSSRPVPRDDDDALLAPIDQKAMRLLELQREIRGGHLDALGEAKAVKEAQELFGGIGAAAIAEKLGRKGSVQWACNCLYIAALPDEVKATLDSSRPPDQWLPMSFVLKNKKLTASEQIRLAGDEITRRKESGIHTHSRKAKARKDVPFPEGLTKAIDEFESVIGPAIEAGDETFAKMVEEFRIKDVHNMLRRLHRTGVQVVALKGKLRKAIGISDEE